MSSIEHSTSVDSADKSPEPSPVVESKAEDVLPRTLGECRNIVDFINFKLSHNPDMDYLEAEDLAVVELYKNAKTRYDAKHKGKKDNKQGGSQKQPPKASTKTKRNQEPKGRPDTSKPERKGPGGNTKQPNTPAPLAQANPLQSKERKPASYLANHPNSFSKFSETQRTEWKGIVNRFNADHPVVHAPGPHDQLIKIKELKLDYRDPVGTFNAHTLGATVRAALRRRCLLKAVLEGHTHLAEFFGNEQTLQFVSDLNAHLKTYGWNGSLKIDVLGEHLSSKDINRRSGEQQHSVATYGMMIDIYDHDCVQDSDSLVQYMRSHAPQMVSLYIIHNVMRGYAGTAPGYIWYAPSDNRRVVQIGDSSPIEHGYFDWLDQTSHSTSAGWHEDRSFSLSETVKMVGTIFTAQGRLDPPPVVRSIKTCYQYFGVPQSKFAQLKNWFKGEQPMILLDRRMLDHAMSRYSNKNQTEFVYSSIKLHINQLLRDDAWVKLSTLMDYDNDYVASVMTDLVMHKTYHQNQRSYSAINPYVQKFQSVSVNSMFTPKPAPRVNPTIEKYLKIGGATAGLVLLFLYYRRRVLMRSVKQLLVGTILPTDQMFGDIVLAPLLEEAIKRVIPYDAGTLALALYETYRDRRMVSPPILIGRFLMHVLASKLPYKFGVGVHALWNIYAYWRSYPEIFSLASWKETMEYEKLVANTHPVTGSLVNVATIISLYKFLTTPTTSFEEYQNALIHDSTVLEYSHGIQSLDCPEFTTCPPATFVDNEIVIPDDRMIKVHDQEFNDWEQVIELFHDNYDPSVQTKIYHVITFNGPSMWAPQTLKNSTYAALCLAFGRIGKYMPLAPKFVCWRFCDYTDRMKNTLAIFDCSRGSYQQWLGLWRSHVIATGKWHKYEKFWEDALNIDENDFRVRRSLQRIQIMAKADEVLLGKTIAKLLPRPIDNIAPIVSFLTGPLDFMLKHALLDGKDSRNLDSFLFPYRHMNLDVYELAHEFFWVPALGFTQLDLTLIMQQFCHRNNAGMLLSHGDDTLLVYIKNGKIIMMESDLSACDRSLTKPSLTFERDLIDYCLQLAGVDQKFFAANRVAYDLNFADRKINEVTVSLCGDAQRPTGCTRTSLMNTVLTAFPILLYHLDHRNNDWTDILKYRPPMFHEYYRAHGLDAKVKTHSGSLDDFPTGTFLKGVWLATDCGTLAWTRLPSMALKMFKTLKPLTLLTKRHKKEVVTLDEARRRYCVMLATSWVSFDLPHGIRQWVDKWSDPDHSYPILTLDHRVGSGCTSLYTFSNERAMRALSEHYAVDIDLFVDWCAKFASLEPGQGYIHAMWPALSRDY